MTSTFAFLSLVFIALGSFEIITQSPAVFASRGTLERCTLVSFSESNTGCLGVTFEGPPQSPPAGGEMTIQVVHTNVYYQDTTVDDARRAGLDPDFWTPGQALDCWSAHWDDARYPAVVVPVPVFSPWVSIWWMLAGIFGFVALGQYLSRRQDEAAPQPEEKEEPPAYSELVQSEDALFV